MLGQSDPWQRPGRDAVDRGLAIGVQVNLAPPTVLSSNYLAGATQKFLTLAGQLVVFLHGDAVH
jgi:hypothetical protein